MAQPNSCTVIFELAWIGAAQGPKKVGPWHGFTERGEIGIHRPCLVWYCIVWFAMHNELIRIHFNFPCIPGSNGGWGWIGETKTTSSALHLSCELGNFAVFRVLCVLQDH